MQRKAILITGCSSGIGRATARHLAERGELVFATARRPETIADLEGCEKLALDVTDEESMAAAVRAVEDHAGAVGVLINNAGYGLHGAFEETPIEQVRRQFETNVIGLVRLTQMVLPGMRAQGWGRVINISSMGGKLTFPGGAFYHATKHALEAMSDALRFEVRRFGIDVVVIEPGLIRTRFGETATDSIADASGPYARFNEKLAKTITGAYEGPMSAFASSPDIVARKIGRAVSAKRPRTRYVVPSSIKGLLFMRRILPDRAFDVMLRTQYPSR